MFSSLLTIAALLAVVAGVWYYFFGPLAMQRSATAHAQQEITHAQQTIQSAAGQDPEAAFAALSRERQALVDAANDPNADENVRQQARAFLSNEFAAAVQSAAQRYTAAARIKTVPADSILSYQGNICTPPGCAISQQAMRFIAAAIPATPPAQYLYPISSGTLYRVAHRLPSQGAGLYRRARAGSLVCALLPEHRVWAGLLHNSAYAVFSITPDIPSPSGVPWRIGSPCPRTATNVTHSGGLLRTAGTNGQAGVFV